jgi:ABC-type bacteriocin/lantibiotic exporter with double-glycine peptidase domain
MTGGIPLWGSLLVLVMTGVFLFSCVTHSAWTRFEGSQLIEDVPFFRQKKYQCGPASLAGVLSFWGVMLSPADVSKEIFSPSARGTLDQDMVFYAESKGLKATRYRGSLEDLTDKVDSGCPLIVLVDRGYLVYQQNHFMVVVGYKPNGIIAHSGTDPRKLIPLRSFLRSWEKTGFWTLFVRPSR